ncbi:MAG: type II secretion system protein [Phycisphaerae bacterium]
MSDRRFRHRGRAFTLIELLVVIAIIALLVSILVPTLAVARELGRNAKCKANEKAMGTGLTMYIADNADYLPPQYVAIFYNTSGGYYLHYWCDRMCRYFDASAHPAEGPTCHTVAEIPPDGQWTYYNYGYPITYSRVMDCPSQKSRGYGYSKYIMNGLYGWSQSWAAPSGSLPAYVGTQTTPGGEARIGFYKKPFMFGEVVDTGLLYWYSINWNPSLSNQNAAIGAGAPHGVKGAMTLNIMYLDGHVGSMTAKEMIGYQYPNYPFCQYYN